MPLSKLRSQAHEEGLFHTGTGAVRYHVACLCTRGFLPQAGHARCGVYCDPDGFGRILAHEPGFSSLQVSIVTRTQSKRYFFKEVDSPVGRLKLVASEAGLAAILWEHENPRRVPVSQAVPDNQHPVLLTTERQLKEYFAGQRKRFDLELDLAGTPFQCRVWQALLTIPYGETRSYGQLAKQLGNPRATRAVGAANGRNPVSIIVPCHRVIGS